MQVRNEGNRLILESEESAYMHHANVLSAVTVSAPRDVVVTFEPLPQGSLQGHGAQ